MSKFLTGNEWNWRLARTVLQGVLGVLVANIDIKELIHMSISRANVAVQVMRHLCTCVEHGYSQLGRFGAPGYCNVSTDMALPAARAALEVVVADKGLPMPRYRVAVMIEDEKTWLDWMCGLKCECGHCDDTYGGIPGMGIVDVEIDKASLGGGWYVKNVASGKLIGLTVYYLTSDPVSMGYHAAYYRVHWMGPNAAWGKWEYDDDGDGASNNRDQVDMIELTICPV